MPLFSAELLKKYKTTAYAIAKHTKISPSNIYKYRDGTLCPTLGNARKIARALVMSLEDLGFKKEPY